AAALLHDTIEDTNTTYEELVEAFGDKIASIVAEVTDDKLLPKDERKRLQVEHAASISHEAKLVKLADKICNLEDILHSQPAGWGSGGFCYIKAFDVRVRRPVAGDRVTYEVGKDAQGRLTAMKFRPVGLEEAQYQSNIRLNRNTKTRQSLSATNVGILICLI